MEASFLKCTSAAEFKPEIPSFLFVLANGWKCCAKEDVYLVTYGHSSSEVCLDTLSLKTKILPSCTEHFTRVMERNKANLGVLNGSHKVPSAIPVNN